MHSLDFYSELTNVCVDLDMIDIDGAAKTLRTAYDSGKPSVRWISVLPQNYS